VPACENSPNREYKAVSAARVTGFELCPLRVTKMPLICAALVAMTTFSQLNLRQV
jgi:hypothetical protein